MTKTLTRAQLESCKEKAARFVPDVLGDTHSAYQIEDESLEDYAERRNIKNESFPKQEVWSLDGSCSI